MPSVSRPQERAAWAAVAAVVERWDEVTAVAAVDEAEAVAVGVRRDGVLCVEVAVVTTTRVTGSSPRDPGAWTVLGSNQ